MNGRIKLAIQQRLGSGLERGCWCWELGVGGLHFHAVWRVSEVGSCHRIASTSQYCCGHFWRDLGKG